MLMRVHHSNLLMVHVAVAEHTVVPAVVTLHTVVLLMGIQLGIHRIAVQRIVRQLKSQHNIGIRRELVGSLAK